MAFKEIFVMYLEKLSSKFPLTLLLTTLLTGFSHQAGATEFYLQGSLALSQPDAGSGSDLELTTSPRFIAGLAFTPNISAEVGFYYLYTEQDSEKEDVVSQYLVSITSKDLLLGVKGQFNINNRISFYGRGGLLLWNTELEVEENFWNIIPGDKVSDDDNGVGYYISGGIIIHFTERLYMDAYLSHHQRNDIFKDDSAYPIDITETLGGVGLGFSF